MLHTFHHMANGATDLQRHLVKLSEKPYIFYIGSGTIYFTAQAPCVQSNGRW